MTENKFWSFIGVALAVMAFFYTSIGLFELLIVGIVTVFFCYLVSYIWNKVSASHHKLVDALYYMFTKNKQKYVVIDKIVRYRIINEKKAEYSLQCNLKSKTNSQDFCYKGRYHWDQEEDIVVNVFCDGGCTHTCSEDLKWSNVDIVPEDRIIHKNDTLHCGFSLKNLVISKLIKHSYLSCKMFEKVHNLKLIAEVNPMLSPADTAAFIVQDSLGEEISREVVNYNKSNGTYEKTVLYPRKGRKYILKWEYQ